MNKYLLICLTVITITIISSCSNEPGEAPDSLNGDVVWDKSYGGDGYETFTTIITTSDGGYLLGGASSSSVSGDRSEASFGAGDYWIIKIDINGNKMWDKTFGGTGSDVLKSMQVTDDGGYLLGGYSQSWPSGNKTTGNIGRRDYDYWIIKINAKGEKVWEKSYGNTTNDYLKGTVSTSDGGYLLAGSTNMPETGESKGQGDYWAVKIDANGNKIWDRAFGGSGYEILGGVTQTSDKSFILAGYSNSQTSGDKSQASKGNYDYWIVKITPDGKKIWDRSFGSEGDDNLLGIIPSIDGGYLLGGSTSSYAAGKYTNGPNLLYDYLVVKVDENGEKQWDKAFGGSLNDFQDCPPLSYPGGFLLGGTSFSDISGDKTNGSPGSVPAPDYWVVNINTSGEKIWDKAFGSQGNSDLMYKVIPASDGGYLLAGESSSPKSEIKSSENKGGSDFWLIKIK